MTFPFSFAASQYVVSVVPTIGAAEAVVRDLQRQGSSPLHWSIIAQDEVLNMIPSRSRLGAMIADGSGIPVLPLTELAAVGFIVNAIITELFNVTTKNDQHALHKALQIYGLSDREAGYHVDAVSQGQILLLIQVPATFKMPRLAGQPVG